MKIVKVIIGTFLFLLFSSCSSLVPYYISNYETNVPLRTYVGAEMLRIESGYTNDMNGLRVNGSMQQLIYAGFQKNTIHIYYREYTSSNQGNYIRDGYTLQLTYDISETDTIRFRDILINVLSANSTEIDFNIITDKAKINKSFSSSRTYTHKTPGRIKPPDEKQLKCAEKYLKKDFEEGWFDVPSEEAYKKYIECRESQ